MDIEAEIVTTLAAAHRHEGVRAGNLNTAGIRAAVKPSNLTAPTRLSEKYAPDSCVADLQLRYVYLDNELLGAQPRSLTLTQAEKSTAAHTEKETLHYPEPTVKSFIPGLVVYERPTWQRSAALESFLRTSVPQSLASSRSAASIVPAEKQPEATQPVAPKSVTKKQETAKKTLKRVNVQIANPAPSDSTAKGESSRSIPRHVAPSKLHSKKRKSMEKTKKPQQERQLNLESTGSVSISEPLISSGSVARWESSDRPMASIPEAREKDDFAFSKSASSGSDFRYEDARTTKHVHYEDELEPKKSDRPDDSIRQLEEMVEEQHKYLVEHGYLSPQSSLSGSRQKTYEDLEREIEQIKDMLGEKSAQLHPDDESGSQLTYSSDEDAEEQESEGEDWMSPRFTE